MRKIGFYYPARNIGGVQVLFVKLANYISANLNYKVFLFDYSDGYLAKNVSENVKLCNPESIFSDFYEPDFCLITPVSNILLFESVVNFKVLYWCLHPENLVDIYRGAQRLRRVPRIRDIIIRSAFLFTWIKIRYFLLNLLMEKRILFMDGPNVQRTFGFYKINKTPVFLPICTDIPEFEESDLLSPMFVKNSPYIHMMWLGRLSGDKIASVEFTIRELSALPNAEYLYLHVVGDGDKRKCILKLIDNSPIKIVLHGSIPNNELKNFISSNEIYCGFGMGTSVLEMAKLHIPSVIVDPAFAQHEKGYMPRWLFMTKNYNLGSFLHDSNGNEISMLLEELRSDYARISRLCYDYVVFNHSISSIVDKLSDHLR